MKQKKVKTPAEIVRAAFRKEWRNSEEYREVRKRVKHPSKAKMSICEGCFLDTYSKLIVVDHKDPVGPLKGDLSNVLEWDSRLRVPADKLWGICPVCDDKKLKTDRQTIAGMRKKNKEAA